VSTGPTLPLSARFALWFSAWCEGRASLDEARDAVVGADAAHHVSGLAGDPDAVPLILALGRLRGHGATGAGLALPAPGDPLGLAGPASFNTAVLEAGQGVVLTGTDLGLVPARAGAGVVWVVHVACSHRQVPDPSEARGALQQALLETGSRLADLDVARWRPEVADELMALRKQTQLPVPSAMSVRSTKLAALASRCRMIVSLALEDDGGALTAAESEQRRAALTPLDHAARRALVAACAFPWDG
jgi:hypothetical protein